MKVIIGENRLLGIMNSHLKLSYSPETREFYCDGIMGGIIGYKYRDGFTYDEEDMMFNLFGENANELLLVLLQKQFPELMIRRIND